MAHETAHAASGRNPNSPAAANGLHASAHAVKPLGTSTNRTSSAANGAGARRVRNTPDENRGFFHQRPDPDGPRSPPPPARPTPPAAGAPAPGNAVPARGGAPCRPHSPDTGVPPATPTRPAPPPGKRRYSNAPEDHSGRTTARTPSTDRSAHGNERGLAAAAKCNHAGPQTQGAPTPDGQVPAAELPLRAGTA
jgi:hypothetical protein